MESKKSIFVGLLTLAMLVIILGGCKKETEPKTIAQDFTLRSFSGEQVSLSDYTGKIVVLEWIHDRCPYVRYHYEKANTMINLANKYEDQGVVWLAVNSTSFATEEQVKNFAEKHNLPYPILDDRSGEVGRSYGARRTPHMFIIDKEGYIAYEGAIDNAPMGNVNGGEQKTDYVEIALSELTAGQQVSTPKTEPYGCTVKYAD